MARSIKAPAFSQQQGYNIINREETLEQAEQRARQIMAHARQQEKHLLDTASAQAERMIADAQAQAENILADAESQRSGIIANAEQKGFEEGLNEGTKKAQESARALLKDLGNMTKEAHNQLQNLLNSQESEIRNLVAEIVSRVVHEKINEDDEIVVRNVKACLKQAADRQHLRILIHPGEEEKIKEYCDDFRREFDDIEEITIDADPRVSEGGVMIETGYGGVDGRIESQLGIVQETITED